MYDPLPPAAARLFPQIHADLLRDGTVLHGETLKKALGFTSVAAMAKSIARKKVDLPFFEMPPRRGLFVLSIEVAYYLARQRADAGKSSKKGGAAMR
jgi:hypothetical protein